MVRWSILAKAENTKAFSPHSTIQEALKRYLHDESESIGLDQLYCGKCHLRNNTRYKHLWTVIKIVLVLPHGNAMVESGFGANEDLLVENLNSESLVGQRNRETS